jgi:hypothetical protein
MPGSVRCHVCTGRFERSGFVRCSACGRSFHEACFGYHDSFECCEAEAEDRAVGAVEL